MKKAAPAGGNAGAARIEPLAGPEAGARYWVSACGAEAAASSSARLTVTTRP